MNNPVILLCVLLLISCNSVGTTPSLLLDEVPLEDNSSKVIIRSDLNKWSPSAGSLALVCRLSQITVDRGFEFYYIDQNSRETDADGRSSLRVRFYKFPPAGMTVVNPLNAVVYKGTWIDGYKHGHGTMIWPNGDRYEGGWLDGVQHGEGTMIWVAGARYEGDWRKGVQHGKGMMRYPNGVIYEGDWAEGKETGHGVFVTENGVRHEGDFIDGNGSTIEGVYITKFDLGILYWTHRNVREHFPHKLEKTELEPMRTSVIDATGYTGICDEVQSSIHWRD